MDSRRDRRPSQDRRFSMDSLTNDRRPSQDSQRGRRPSQDRRFSMNSLTIDQVNKLRRPPFREPQQQCEDVVDWSSRDIKYFKDLRDAYEPDANKWLDTIFKYKKCNMQSSRYEVRKLEQLHDKYQPKAMTCALITVRLNKLTLDQRTVVFSNKEHNIIDDYRVNKIRDMVSEHLADDVNRTERKKIKVRVEGGGNGGFMSRGADNTGLTRAHFVANIITEKAIELKILDSITVRATTRGNRISKGPDYEIDANNDPNAVRRVVIWW